ncbi:seizure protein 6 isoform X1 [Cynoglossus semilaevis]|uniref:seizure protein 6 isoform X1 n=1 Tax=Cynoglossus semilaevis TaxID=244447 RepID=UPI00049730B9|nr:seizure protein 6 homolog isoform X1 [Cynoglossus semilaevis]XP_008306882.1 seizure protein 6 homolog isoform X1 [Cynoglossus semilaevis]
MKKAMRDNFPLLLFVVTALTETGGKASVSEDVQSITMGGSSKDKASLYSTTQDTERRAPAVTTAPPLPIINHHPLYRNPPYYTPSLGLNGQPSYEDSGGSTHPTSATLLSGTSLDNAHRMPPDQMDEDSSITPNPDTHSLSSHFNTAVPASKMLPRDPDGGAIGRFITKEKDTEMPDSAGLKLNVRPGSETTTAAIITTMQSPVPCQFNLTGPEGYIEAPPQSSAAFFSTVDCSYTITAYMGYGVEVQVMNVNLSAGDKVVLEDMGYGENTMLANESILMRGLVVRSHSNQISIRLHSPRALAASVLLRYQFFVLSCVFPRRPLYGDVLVSSLHAGGEAFFSCLTGYQLQGPRVLTCRNASTPYWSGKEPHCLAACGGLIRNITVGRIVSPGFPSNYSNNLTCHWLLEAPEGQRLHIHFEKVALAEDDDRLLIKNGNSIDAAPIYDSYEVEYLPNEGLLSSSRHLFIELTTDAAGTSTGVALRYQAFAAGHCYEPFVKYGNLTSSDNTWAVGAVVEFACDPGYTLEQGSVTIECMDPDNPQWNETEPACRAVCSGEITDSAGVVLSPNWPEAYDKGQDCIWGIHVEEDKRIMLDIQVLNIGKNDLLTFYDGDDLTAKVLGQYGGSKSHFKLYTSTADITIQFQSDPATNVYGYGNGFVVHFFEVPRNDTCPELPEISNGWKSTSHPELVQGTVVTYQCYPGYQVVGAELLMCQWDLTWSGDLPSCERVMSCSDPGRVDHSRRVLSGPHFTVGSTIQYICNKGFTLSGNSLLTCFNRGSSGPKWNQKLPRCLPETFEPCGHPGTPTYAVPSSNQPHFQAGDTLHYSCLPGHQLLGEPVLHCVPGHPSQWSGLPPVCKAHPERYTEPRLDVSTADFRLEGANVAFTVFIPIVLLLFLTVGMYFYFSRFQRKSLHLSVSSNLPYKNISAESATDSSAYETMNNEETREYEVSI